MSFLKQLLRVAGSLVKNRYRFRRVRRNGTTIRFPSSGGFVGEYLSYIAEGLLVALSARGHNRSVCVASNSYQVSSWDKLVFVNLEHTLVRMGGRGSSGALFGAIEVEDSPGEQYLVRLDGDSRLWDRSKVIIDYSLTNIANVASDSRHSDASRKTVYVAPFLGGASTGEEFANRDFSRIFTIMSITDQADRRLAILRKLERETGVAFTNLEGVKNSNDARLAKIGLLLNLHQTNEHHTLEELRLLPILKQRALIVSEPSPLLNLVSYRDFLDFAPEDALGVRIREILEKREQIWHQRFMGDRFPQAMGNLQSQNELAFQQIAQLLDSISLKESRD